MTIRFGNLQIKCSTILSHKSRVSRSNQHFRAPSYNWILDWVSKLACKTRRHLIYHNSIINHKYYIKKSIIYTNLCIIFKPLYWNANLGVLILHIGLNPLHDETTSKSVWAITSKSSQLDIHATFLLHSNATSISLPE